MSDQPEKKPAAESSKDPDRLWTSSFIILTVSLFLLILCLQMLLSPLPSYVKDRFQPGDFTVSLVTSVFALSAIVTRFITAALLKIVHRNVLLFIGITIAAASTGAFAIAGSVTAVLLLRIGFGIGFGIASTVMPTLVSQIIPLRRMGEGIGYFGLSSSLAMSFGPLIGLSVLDGYGFTPLAVMGALSAALIIPLLLISRSIPPQPPKKTRLNQSGAPSGSKIPFNKKLIIPAVLNVLLSVTYGGILGFLALFGKEIHMANVGLFFLFNACTILIIRPISGRLFDSKGPVVVVIPGALIIASSLIILSFTTQLPMLILSALLYGLGFGAIQPTLQAWMLRDCVPEQYGTANSLFYNALDFGVAIGSMALGVIASSTGYAVMYRYSAVCMLLFLIVFGPVRLFRPGKEAARPGLTANQEV